MTSPEEKVSESTAQTLPQVGLEAPREKSVTGIAVFAFQATAYPNAVHRYTLQISVNNSGRATFEKQFEAREITRFWLGLNSHLLQNGANVVSFSLLDSSQKEVWQKTVQLNIANTSRLAERVRDSLQRHHSPLIIDGACDSRQFNYADESLAPWFDKEDAEKHIQDRLVAGEITEAQSELLRQFVADGYIVIENLLGEALLNQINSELDDAIRNKIEGYEYGSSQKIHALHDTYPGVRKLWNHPAVMELLGLIFEEQARPCQSLTYIFGSEQHVHQDTVHLTPFPAGYMCGVWTALQDIEPNSGELELYRGSHRLPRVYVSDVGCAKVKNGDWSEFNAKVLPVWDKMLSAGQFEKITYRPQKGTVLIWHENLMHGGSIRSDKSLSRRSIVTHHFAHGAIAFYDSWGNVGYMEPVENLVSEVSED